ncbi:MAG TPA: GGDEF domain-containing protein [Steroidobacteraceae bacterium]
MHGSPQRALSTEGPALCSANADLAMQLSAAAVDGDRNQVKQLLADLLRRRTWYTDEDLTSLLQALEDLFSLLHSMALTDELTGLHNRRGFLRSGAQLLDMAGCQQHGALLIYIDVDQLKYVNDTSGHAAGDALLRRTAQVLHDVSGNHNVVGRLGGDEFAVLDASTKRSSRNQVLHHIQDAVEDRNASGGDPALSLSIGFAEFDPLSPVSITTLLALADRSMYRHKTRALGRLECALAAP